MVFWRFKCWLRDWFRPCYILRILDFSSDFLFSDKEVDTQFITDFKNGKKDTVDQDIICCISKLMTESLK